MSVPGGSEVEGKVRNLTDFGAFIALEEGIDGLIHIPICPGRSASSTPRKSSEGRRCGRRAECDKDMSGCPRLEADGTRSVDAGTDEYHVGAGHAGEVVKVTTLGRLPNLRMAWKASIHLSELSREDHRPGRVVSVGTPQELFSMPNQNHQDQIRDTEDWSQRTAFMETTSARSAGRQRQATETVTIVIRLQKG